MFLIPNLTAAGLAGKNEIRSSLAKITEADTVKRKLFVLLMISSTLSLTACGLGPLTSRTGNITSTTSPSLTNKDATSQSSLSQELDTAGLPQTNPAPKHNPSDPGGIFSNDNGRTYFLSTTGLTIHTAPPSEGAAKVAWDFFYYQGTQQYDKALLCLHGHQHQDTILYTGYVGDKGTPYLEEVVNSGFVRWADVSGIVSKESEDEGAYKYKIIYLEVNFSLRGKLTKKETGMRNGLNCYAVHVIQERKGDPWEISLLAGTPWMEK